MPTAIPREFTVVALIAAFNEEDVIDQVVTDLIEQGISVYLIDDGSTDRTVSAVTHHLGRGLLRVERREPTAIFDWSALLIRKEQLAGELAADWFLHQDADEFRESPWPAVGLREALWRVDCLGYNAVDFKVLNFRPTTEDPAGPDVRQSMRFYEFADDWDAVQVKAWRKQTTVDLTSVGGHEAQFDGRRIFPIPFLSRHYPIRSQSHGTRKVFAERRPRFSDGERERGWHVQYDALASGHSFVRPASELREFDPVDVRIGLTLEHRDLVTLTSALADLRREHEDKLGDRERQLEELRREHEHKRGDLERQLEELRREHERSLALHERQLEELRQQCAVSSRDLERIRHEFAILERLGDAERRRIARLREELLATLESHAAEVQALTSALSASTETTRRLEAQKMELALRLRDYSTEMARARSEVDELRKSRSWQITAPLRAAYRLARGPDPVAAEGPASRLRPVSDVWGIDRGLPVDRYYIERFLRAHQEDVHGRVLEIKDAGYTRMLDNGRVLRLDVLDVDTKNPNATLIADLAHADHLDAAQFDCFILTQTLHIIYDFRPALGHAIRLLKPGGVLLCTIPAISRVNYENGGLNSGDYWRLTHAAVRQLFDEFLPAASTKIATYGNVGVCSAFLYGLATTELPPEDLEFRDPWFPLIHCIRAVKP